MGCLVSCFQDKYLYENSKVYKTLINNHTQSEDYYSDDSYELEYYPDFFETVYRRKSLYTSD